MWVRVCYKRRVVRILAPGFRLFYSFVLSRNLNIAVNDNFTPAGSLLDDGANSGLRVRAGMAWHCRALRNVLLGMGRSLAPNGLCLLLGKANSLSLQVLLVVRRRRASLTGGCGRVSNRHWGVFLVATLA